MAPGLAGLRNLKSLVYLRSSVRFCQVTYAGKRQDSTAASPSSTRRAPPAASPAEQQQQQRWDSVPKPLELAPLANDDWDRVSDSDGEPELYGSSYGSGLLSRGGYGGDEDDEDDLGSLQAADDEEEGEEDLGRKGKKLMPLLRQKDEKERVYLVGVTTRKDKLDMATGAYYGVQESLEELGRLADTAGLQVVGSTFQTLAKPNPATYIGSGKVAQLAAAVAEFRIETVIMDDELSPGQLRNLEKAFGGTVKVCDRTALILDIFSQRAQTREGKLQVELAQVEYQLPRLTRMWTHLDRVGGGGQVKGTGEKQIETDKRELRDLAGQLRKELEQVRTHRRNYRNKRSQTPIPVVCIVGYTNAGKSTLLNRLTAANVLAENKLFATLDPTTRRVRLPSNKEVLLSDTVGFIQKLPTELVAAFRATLEEIQDAALLLHIVDISHPSAQAQSEAVEKVLSDLAVGQIRLITAWNKVDACPEPDVVKATAAARTDTVCISGLSGEGMDELLDLIQQKVESSMTTMELLLPFSAGDLLAELHTVGSIQSKEYSEHGTLVVAFVPPSLYGRLKQYSVVPIVEPEPVLQEELDTFNEEGYISFVESSSAESEASSNH